MKRPVLLLLLPALLLPFAGCMVPKKKYDAAIAERDRLAKLVDQRDSELATAQDEFRKRLEAANQDLELYKKQAGESKADADKARAEIEKSRRQIEGELQSLGVGTVRDGRLVLEDTLLFQLGSDDLTTAGKAGLDKIAKTFKGRDVLIQIDGHTDSTPIAKAATKREHGDNMGLSAHRAITVFRYLASKGIAERRMYIRSFASSWPVAPEGSAASKAKNRRVEILFVPAAAAPMTPAPKPAAPAPPAKK